MCDTFNMYNRRVNGLQGVKECAVVSTSELEWLRAQNERLRDALIWCSGASDFAPGGIARKGWEKACQPLLKPEVFANANH